MYVKNLGGMGGTVKFKDKQGTWSKLLWKRWSHYIADNQSSINVGNVLDVKQLIQDLSSCSYREWGGLGQSSKQKSLFLFCK